MNYPDYVLSASGAVCCRLSLRAGDQQAALVGFKLAAIQKGWVWDPWRTCASGRSRGGAHRWGLDVVGEGWEWRVRRGFSDEFISEKWTKSAIDERIALLRHWLFERIDYVEDRSMSLFGWLSYRRARGVGAGACKVDCGKEGRWSGPQQVYQEGPVQARAQTGTQMLGVGLPGYVGRLQHLLLVVGRDVLPWKLTWALRCRRSPAFVRRPLARDAYTVEGVRIVAVAGTVRLWRNVWECSRGLASSRAFMVVVIEPRSVCVRVLLWRVGEATLGECGVAQ